MIRNSELHPDDETNFPYKLFLINRQVSNLRRSFAKYTSTDVKLSKTQLYKVIQLGRLFGRHLRSITKNRVAINEKFNSIIN